MTNTPYNILLAEDDAMLSDLIATRFRQEGWTVDVAQDGEVACSMLGNAYDVMILDLMMPKMDGFGVLEEVKKQGIRLPIIVASNMSEASEIQRAIDLGAVDTLIKSDIELDSLVDRVRGVVEKYAAQQ